MTNKEKAIEFLKEYAKLCQKYEMGLRGCGCCHSPWLEYEHNQYLDDVNYNNELNDVTIDGKSIKELLEDD